MTKTIADLAQCVQSVGVGQVLVTSVDLSDCGWSFAQTLCDSLGDDYFLVASSDFRALLCANDLYFIVYYDRLHAVDVSDVLMSVACIAGDVDAMNFYYSRQ